MLARPNVIWRVKSCSHIPGLSSRVNSVGEMQRQDRESELLDGEVGRSSSKQPSTYSPNDATWDASYGIVFGKPSPAPAECSPTPRTYRRYPSDQFRHYSTSAIASTPAVTVQSTQAQKPPATRAPNPTTAYSDPFASLNPLTRLIARGSNKETGGPRDAKAPKRQLAPRIQPVAPVRDLLPKLEAYMTEVKEFGNINEQIANIATDLRLRKVRKLEVYLAELRTFEKVNEQIASSLIDLKLINVLAQIDEACYAVDLLVGNGVGELQEIKKALKARRNLELQEMVERRWEEPETTAEIIAKAILECQVFYEVCYEDFLKEAQQEINELKDEVTYANRKMDAIKFQIAKVQDGLKAWENRKRERADQIRQEIQRIRSQAERKWGEKEDFIDSLQEAYTKVRGLAEGYTQGWYNTEELVLGEKIAPIRTMPDLNDDVDISTADAFATALEPKTIKRDTVQGLKLSNAQGKGLRTFLELQRGSLEHLQDALHEWRETLRIQVYSNSDVVEPEMKLLHMWKYYRDAPKSILGHRLRKFAARFEGRSEQNQYQLGYDDAFRAAINSWTSRCGKVLASYKTLMENIDGQYRARQSGVYHSLLDYDQALATHFQGLSTVVGALRDFLLLLPTKPRSRSVDKLWEIRRTLANNEIPSLDALMKKVLFLHVWSQNLQTSNLAEEPVKQDEPRPNDDLNGEDAIEPRENRAKDRLDDLEIDILQKLESRYKNLLASKSSESWLGKPYVWEVFELDVSLRTLDELKSDADMRLPSRLGEVLVRENILTRDELSILSTTKEGLLCLNAKLKQLSQANLEQIGFPLPQNPEQRLLDDIYALFKPLNDCIEILSEQATLPWIQGKTRAQLMTQTALCVRTRKELLGGVWNTVLALTLDKHGLNLPLHYHTGDSTRVLSARSRNQSTSKTMNESQLSFQRRGGSKTRYWDCSQYRGPRDEPVKIHYCCSLESTDRVVRKHFADEQVLGFDMEWKANSSSSDSIKDNVSLIQIASESRIGLFHIARYEKDSANDLIAPSLKLLMESEKVMKTGVNIKADCTRLRKHLSVDSKGLFELSHLYKLVKFSDDPAMINKRPVKLSVQVEEHLGLAMWKGDVRTSDWTKKLEPEQTLYAASDPYACLHLYDVLESKRKSLHPIPPRPDFAENDTPICLVNGQPAKSFKKAVKEVEALEVKIEDDGESISASSSSLDWETELALEQSIRDEDSLEQAERELRADRRRNRNVTRIRRTMSPHQMTMRFGRTMPSPQKEVKLSRRYERIYYRAKSWTEKVSKLHHSTGKANVELDVRLVSYALWYRGSLSVAAARSLTNLVSQRSFVTFPEMVRQILEAIRVFKLPADEGRMRSLRTEIARYQGPDYDPSIFEGLRTKVELLSSETHYDSADGESMASSELESLDTSPNSERSCMTSRSFSKPTGMRLKLETSPQDNRATRKDSPALSPSSESMPRSKTRRLKREAIDVKLAAAPSDKADSPNAKLATGKPHKAAGNKPRESLSRRGRETVSRSENKKHRLEIDDPASDTESSDVPGYKSTKDSPRPSSSSPPQEPMSGLRTERNRRRRDKRRRARQSQHFVTENCDLRGKTPDLLPTEPAGKVSVT